MAKRRSKKFPAQHPLWETFVQIVNEMHHGDTKDILDPLNDRTWDDWEWFLCGARNGVQVATVGMVAAMKAGLEEW